MLKTLVIVLLGLTTFTSLYLQAGLLPPIISNDANTQQILSQADFNANRGSKQKIFGLNHFKPVIIGVLYRGGSAGTRKANDPDSGVLTQTQLMTLCQAGFSKAVYAYGKSKHLIPSVNCIMTDGRHNTLNYEGVSYSNKSRFVEIIDDVIQNNKGPVYDHCWNGWHASGELAAITLKQYCDFSSDEAKKYWEKNRYDKANVPSLLNRIANYQNLDGLATLNAATQNELCPPKP